MDGPCVVYATCAPCRFGLSGEKNDERAEWLDGSEIILAAIIFFYFKVSFVL